MKKLFFILIGLFIAVNAKAENAPQDVVREIVGKMKQERTPAVVLEYVNWEKAFNKFPALQKEKLGVNSADELRAFFDNMLRNPSEVVRQKITAEMKDAKPEDQKILSENLEKVVSAIAKKEDEMKTRIASTTYEIGAVDVKGDTASVMLTQIYKGERKTEKVLLEKEAGKWMLPTAGEFGGSSGNAESSSGKSAGTQF